MQAPDTLYRYVDLCDAYSWYEGQHSNRNTVDLCDAYSWYEGQHGNRNTHKKGKQLWWRHQMETFSALLAICVENSPVPGEFPAQRPVTRSFDVFIDLRLNDRLSKQSWGWWFETLSRPLWRHWCLYNHFCVQYVS